MHRALLLAPLLGAALPALATGEPCTPTAEVAVDGMGVPEDDLLRVGELAGAVPTSARLVRRAGPRREQVCDVAAPPFAPLARRLRAREEPGKLDLAPVPVRLSSVWNMRYPSGGNDGLLWAGRGLSQIASAGVALRYGMLSAALVPEVSWSENRAFELVPNGLSDSLRFGNPFYGDQIDYPQRFGVGPFATWGLGQSYVQVERWNVALGLSTENLWLGPGIRNAILLSNAGPGFPHLYVGTARPVDVWIGDVEALLFWGRLERTQYIADGGHPLIQGLGLTYAPRWIPGLSVGLGRMFVQPWAGLRLVDYFEVVQPFAKDELKSLYGPAGDNPFDNQIASVFWRWVFPESGLEVYGEWAREDHEWSWWGFVREPDHSQGYLLGLQKVFRDGPRLIRAYTEFTHLQEIRPLDAPRGTPVFYTHGNDLSLTNRGQLLGAWIGPGADSQTLAVDVLHRGGRIGGYLERVRRNDAFYWANATVLKDEGHDAELALGARQVLELGRFEVSWDVSAAWRQNRDFLHDEPNVRVVLDLALPFGAVQNP